MIKNITIKKTATYDNNGTELTNLKKINFIYGANGSGKTTLSNFVADSTDTRYLDCNIEWKHNQPLKTLVYNKEFRDRNFGNGNINGVFTLGQATDEDIRIINEKKEKLEVIKEQGTDFKKSLDKIRGTESEKGKIQILEETFKEECWKNVYKKYENNFKEAFVGSMQKQKFKEKLLSQFTTNNSQVVTFEELKETSKTIFGTTPQTISPINNINYDEITLIEDNEIWDKKIIGKADVDIAKMIHQLNLNDWVHHGKAYLQDDDICPFCQEKTITNDFRKQLESYFDKSFLEVTQQISNLAKSYNSQSDNIFHQLEQIETTTKNNPDTKLDIDKFSAYLKTIASQFSSNKVLLSNKISEPSRSIELISTKEQLKDIQTILEKANVEILKNNSLVDNYQSEKQVLISSIWKYLYPSKPKKTSINTGYTTMTDK